MTIDYNTLWPQSHAIRAKAEGWELALTVNSGDPITRAYFMIYDVSDDKTFKTRLHAQRHVSEQASKGSKFHRKAVDAVMNTRMFAGPTRKKK
jgi:hypothetical protein